MKQKFTQFINRLRGFFPSATPVGITEFDQWAQSIIDTYKPAADDVSVKFALCAMLMRLGPTEAYKPKRYFALALHKGAASQIANGVMYEIKTKQAELEKQAQEAAKKSAEATASQGVTPTLTVVSNDSPTQAS